MKKNITIALVGQPNVGKSMLINSISNSKLKVGNFAGVTVEKATANFTYKDYNVQIVDLPGTYALNEYSIEEKVVKDFLFNEVYDIILNVVDSTNLERNLYLTSELLESDKKVVLALNMSDEADKEEIKIDEVMLSTILGIPCVKTSSITKFGLNNVLEECIALHEEKKQPSKLTFSVSIEIEIENIVMCLNTKGYKHKNMLSQRSVAIKLLQGDKTIYNDLQHEPLWIDLEPIVRDSNKKLYLKFDTNNLEEIFSNERASFAKGACLETVKIPKKVKETLTDKVDNILLNKYFGIPIFLFFMWIIFQATFTLGAVPMDYIDLATVWLQENALVVLGDGELGSLISDGIIAGVGAVIMFLPNIVILFAGIVLLELTGYMSRAAFLLDGFFHRFGLHGKSFIPLVSGFGCSVPAYMATRTLKNDSDRLLTLFVISFMSCGAKLPIYVLFIGAFFADYNPGNILFIIYLSGAMLGLVAAKVLKKFAFKGKDDPFVMEMPKYRLPSLKLFFQAVLSKAWMYLKKAGTFILAASILIWFASTYPKYPNIEAEFGAKIELVQDNEEEVTSLENELQKVLLENSYLGKIGHATEPLFTPLGFDWRMTVALETGLAAKEVVVATLGILYSLGNEVTEEDVGLIKTIGKSISFPSAVAFIIFVLIYIPCAAATVVFTKEAGKYKYLLYFIVFTMTTAWVMAFIGYHITKLII